MMTGSIARTLAGAGLVMLTATVVLVSRASAAQDAEQQEGAGGIARVERPRVPAFPGAEGFGKWTTGGRGGDVYAVTNLRDAGPGSLRRGLVSARGPRTIVFDVGGTLTLKSPLIIENKSGITLAGQTAPGKGITLRDHCFHIRNSREIVVRYLRVRLGDRNKKQGDSPDTMTVDHNDQVILDHLSLSWGIDGNSDYRGNSNMTLQWLIYSEALNRSLHHAGCSLVRDTVDERTIENIRKGRGRVIDSQEQVGGWDPYPEIHRPAGWDTDGDGMPDAWERSHGLDPGNPSDGNGDADGDGYTNLEEYLNSLVPDRASRRRP